MGHSGKFPAPVYSPPLAPLAFGLSLVVARKAIWASIVFGTAAVLLVFRIVSQLLKSTRAALFAAALLAVSGWHIMYSRLLLTESLYVFLLLLVIATSLEYLAEPRLKWAAVTGLAVFALQYTKYNGFLASGPLLSVMLYDVFALKDTARRRERLWHGFVLSGIVVAGIASEILIIKLSIGVRAYLTSYSTYVGSKAASVSQIVAYLAYVNAAPVLLFAVVGLIFTVSVLRSKEWALIHVTASLYVLFLFHYTFYLRLLAPISTLLVIYCGAGVHAMSLMIRKRAAEILCMPLMIVAAAANTASRSANYLTPDRSGYEKASAYICSLPPSITVIRLAQSNVWTGGRESERQLPQDARAVLANIDHLNEAYVVADLYRFHKYNSRAVHAGQMLERYLPNRTVLRIPNPVPIEVVENGLSWADLQRMEGDQAFKDEIYSIVVVRLRRDELRQVLMAAMTD